jgi:hypothetical protein
MAVIAYLSGPMQGVAEHNFPAFYHAEAVLRAKGYLVLNPARNFGGRVDLPREQYIREDVALLVKSDEVWVLPGWQGSEGAKLEVAIAVATGIPVIDYESQTRILPHIALNLLTTSPAGCVVVSSGTATTTETAESICAEADRAVSTAKRSLYGHPRENFAHTAKLWSAYKGVEFSLRDVAILMMLLKLSRAHHQVTRDTLVDVCGYAKTIAILEGWES